MQPEVKPVEKIRFNERDLIRKFIPVMIITIVSTLCCTVLGSAVTSGFALNLFETSSFAFQLLSLVFYGKFILRYFRTNDRTDTPWNPFH